MRSEAMEVLLMLAAIEYRFWTIAKW